MEQKTQVTAIGRRKEAVARVYLQVGTGKTLVNGKELVDYLGREVLVMQVREPLEVTDSLGKYDIVATVDEVLYIECWAAGIVVAYDLATDRQVILLPGLPNESELGEDAGASARGSWVVAP